MSGQSSEVIHCPNCKEDVPKTLYCLNCGYPLYKLEQQKKAEEPVEEPVAEPEPDEDVDMSVEIEQLEPVVEPEPEEEELEEEPIEEPEEVEEEPEPEPEPEEEEIEPEVEPEEEESEEEIVPEPEPEIETTIEVEDEEPESVDEEAAIEEEFEEEPAEEPEEVEEEPEPEEIVEEVTPEPVVEPEEEIKEEITPEPVAEPEMEQVTFTSEERETYMTDEIRLEFAPDPLTKEVMENLAKNITLKIRLVRLLRESGVKEETFKKLFDSYVEQGRLWVSRRDEIIRRFKADIGRMEDELVTARKDFELLEIRKNIGDASEEEYSVKAPAYKWDIENLDNEIKNTKGGIQYVINLKGLIPEEEVAELKAMADSNYRELDSVDGVSSDTIARMKESLSEALVSLEN